MRKPDKQEAASIARLKKLVGVIKLTDKEINRQYKAAAKELLILNCTIQLSTYKIAKIIGMSQGWVFSVLDWAKSGYPTNAPSQHSHMKLKESREKKKNQNEERRHAPITDQQRKALDKLRKDADAVLEAQEKKRRQEERHDKDWARKHPEHGAGLKVMFLARDVKEFVVRLEGLSTKEIGICPTKQINELLRALKVMRDKCDRITRCVPAEDDDDRRPDDIPEHPMAQRHSVH